MSLTLWEVLVYHLVKLIERDVVEDFRDVHFSCVTVDSRVADSDTNGFSNNLFAILVYYLLVGDVGLEMVVRNAVFVLALVT